jgi:hypothetical protein
MKLFSEDFRKKKSNNKFQKIRPVGVELFHTDGQTDGWTDMTKLIVAFRNSVKDPDNTIRGYA